MAAHYTLRCVNYTSTWGPRHESSCIMYLCMIRRRRSRDHEKLWNHRKTPQSDMKAQTLLGISYSWSQVPHWQCFGSGSRLDPDSNGLADLDRPKFSLRKVTNKQLSCLSISVGLETSPGEDKYVTVFEENKFLRHIKNFGLDPDWIRIQQNIRIRSWNTAYWTCQNNQRRHFFSDQVIDSWNKIPNAVKNVESVSAFKRGYKNHWDATVTPT